MHDDNQFGPHSHSPDQAIQQATVNLLADMGAQPSTLQTGDDPNRLDDDDRNTRQTLAARTRLVRHDRAELHDHVTDLGDV